MLEVVPANRLITVMNPWAEDKSESKKRISAGLDKLFETTEAERLTLFEASLIRYFQPPFNREFKDSFPSTHLKILADCYEKDFSTLEIGRASCRERVCQYVKISVVAVSSKQQTRLTTQ